MSFEIKPVNISREEEAALLKIVRATERARTVDEETGETRTRYFPTDEQRDAMERIVASYENAITHAALKAKTISREDAVQVGRMTIMRLAYESKTTNDRLSGVALREIKNDVMKADGQAAPLAIPHESLRVYMNLVTEYGSTGDAYAALKGGDASGMTAYTFYAINRALNADSVEGVAATGEEGEDYAVFTSLYGDTLSPEEIVLEEDDRQQWIERVRRAMLLLTETQDMIVRLSYGFDDRVSMYVRRNSDLGDELDPSDKTVSDALTAAANVIAATDAGRLYPLVRPMSRPTVNRQRTSAIVTMQQEIIAEIAAEAGE